MNNNKHLNLRTLHDVRIAKERFRYQLLQNQLTLKEEIGFFKETVKNFSVNPFNSYAYELLSLSLGKLFRRKKK